MLSLEKATTDAELDTFLARFPDQAFALWPKFDGLWVSVLYRVGGWRGRRRGATARWGRT